MNSPSRILEWQDLGTMPYPEALALQERLRDERAAGEVGDLLLLLEHPPVITLGRKSCDEDVVSSPQSLRQEGIEVIKTQRGGRATYHGPGQVVGYLICDLRGLKLGVQEFVAAVEEFSIRTLAEYGIAGTRDAQHPGIWVGREKIVAVGLSIHRGITMHGFALNATCDLSAFGAIVACGIRDRGVTSMARLLGKAVDLGELKRTIARNAGDVLGCRMVKGKGGVSQP